MNSKNYFFKERKKLAKQTECVQPLGDNDVNSQSIQLTEGFQNEDVPCASKNFAVLSSSLNEQIRKTLKDNECDNLARDKFVLWSDEENSPLKKEPQPRRNSDEVERSVGQNKVDINTLLSVEAIPLCPICFKKNTFVQNDAFIVHLKNCASKNNLSTTQLIKAIELLQKQVGERTALGLPKVQEKSSIKRTTSKKGGADANLELAMALSASLRESEMIDKMRETEMLLEAGLEKEALSQCKKLEDFGFKGPTTSNASSSSSRNIREQKNLRNTLLFTRSQQERERILTEKVAIILIDADTLNEPRSTVDNRRRELRSSFLKKYFDSDSTLWKKSHLLDEYDEDDFYYCKNLSSFISPCKLFTGAKLKHISQIPQRLPSPIKTEIKDSSLSELAALYFQPDPEPEIKPENIVPAVKPKNVAPANISNQASPQMPEYRKLSQAWKSLINKSTFSDVTIYAKNERAIKAHKLVLHVRCPAILTETIKECENGKYSEMVMWMNYDYETVIVFLEYLYSGDMVGVNQLSEKQRADLKDLSSNYNVYEVRSFVDQLDLVNEEPIVIESDDDDVVKVEMTDGEKNLRSLELELEARTFNSSPVGSPEMFGNEEDESTLDELHLCLSEEETDLVKCTTNDLSTSEKRKSRSPLEEKREKKMRLEYDTPSDVEIDFNTPNFSQLSIATQKEEREEKNKETVADGDSDSTPDLIEQNNDVCVVETSPYVSPVWDGFEDVNYDRINGFACEIDSVTPCLNRTKLAKTSVGGKLKRRSNEPFFDSFDVNLSDLDRLVDEEVTKTQPVATSSSAAQNTTPLSIKKFECRSKSDNVLTPISKGSPAITPMADYSNMKTKDLKKELDRYGLKPGLNRNKAKKLLRYIYDQLHPYEDDSHQGAGVSSTSLASNSTPKSGNANTLEHKENDSDEYSSQSSSVEFLDESFQEDEADILSDEIEGITQSNRVSLDVGFRKLIDQDKDLHQKILLYEPIWLEPLRSSLKTLNVKFNANELVNYLDEKCITYRTLQTRSRRKRKKSKKTGIATQISAR